MAESVSGTKKKKYPALLPEDSLCKFVSPLRYPGGKQRAVKTISKLLPNSVNEYREPLVGGGSIFFHARTKNIADRYWINDEFEELISFWRIVQNEQSNQQLMEELESLRSNFQSSSEIKEYFNQVRKEVACDRYRQAFLFFFFNRVTFSGTTRAGGFSSQASIDRFTKSSIERLKQLPKALAKTRITKGDFEKVILEEGDDVFIFLDPPYYNAKRLYGKNGSLHKFDHVRLSEVLKNTKHKFLMTYDDSEEVRNLYKWAQITEWNLQYGMNNCNLENTSKLGNELFIKNY